MALLGALLLVFTIFVRPQEFIPELANVGLLNVATVIALLGILIEMATGKIGSAWSPQLPYLGAFLLWCAVTTGAKVGLAAILDLKESLVFPTTFMLVVMYAGRSFGRFRALAVAVTAIALFLCAVCVHQAQPQFQCILLATEESGDVAHDRSHGESDGRACEEDHQCDIEGSDAEYVCEKPGLFETFTVGHGRVRWRGTFADPNELSLVVGAAISFVFAMHARSRRWVRHVLALAAIAAAVYTVVLTGSRGGVLVLLVIFAVYFVRRYGLKGVFAGALLGMPLLVAGGRGGEDAEASSLERLGALYQGVDFFMANPVLGLGQGQFPENYFITAHNSYLLAASELGFPGLVLWLSLLYASIKIPLVIATRPPPGLDPRFFPYALALVTSFSRAFWSGSSSCRSATTRCSSCISASPGRSTAPRRAPHPRSA